MTFWVLLFLCSLSSWFLLLFDIPTCVRKSLMRVHDNDRFLDFQISKEWSPTLSCISTGLSAFSPNSDHHQRLAVKTSYITTRIDLPFPEPRLHVKERKDPPHETPESKAGPLPSDATDSSRSWDRASMCQTLIYHTASATKKMQIRRRKIRALGAAGSEKKQVCWEEEKRGGVWGRSVHAMIFRDLHKPS